MPIDLPLSAWATAEQPARTQRKGRYVEISGHHPAKMLPAIAARAVATYTRPGDLVCDPMCGIGSTLVEAVHQGRDAVGVEYEPEWAELARANLAYARSQGATGHGEVVCGDARHLTAVVDPAVTGLVALVLTSPPYGPSLHGRVTARPGRGVTKAHNRYSTDPANLAHVGLDGLLEGMRAILSGCARLLRPDGYVAMTVRPGGATASSSTCPPPSSPSASRPASFSTSATSPSSPDCAPTSWSPGSPSSPNDATSYSPIERSWLPNWRRPRRNFQPPSSSGSSSRRSVASWRRATRTRSSSFCVT
jgi:SAM-dependent methyltransferase